MCKNKYRADACRDAIRDAETPAARVTRGRGLVALYEARIRLYVTFTITPSRKVTLPNHSLPMPVIWGRLHTVRVPFGLYSGPNRLVSV